MLYKVGNDSQDLLQRSPSGNLLLKSISARSFNSLITNLHTKPNNGNSTLSSSKGLNSAIFGSSESIISLKQTTTETKKERGSNLNNTNADASDENHSSENDESEYNSIHFKSKENLKFPELLSQQSLDFRIIEESPFENDLKTNQIASSPSLNDLDHLNSKSFKKSFKEKKQPVQSQNSLDYLGESNDTIDSKPDLSASDVGNPNQLDLSVSDMINPNNLVSTQSNKSLLSNCSSFSNQKHEKSIDSIHDHDNSFLRPTPLTRKSIKTIQSIQSLSDQGFLNIIPNIEPNSTNDSTNKELNQSITIKSETSDEYKLTKSNTVIPEHLSHQKHRRVKTEVSKISYLTQKKRTSEISEFVTTRTIKDNLMLKVVFPDDTSTIVKYPSDTKMEEVLIQLCKKRVLNPDLYNFKYEDSPIDLDRPLDHYVNFMEVKSVRLSIGNPKYSTLKEVDNNGKDVMVYQIKGSSIYVITSSFEKVIDLITDPLQPDPKFAELVLFSHRHFSTSQILFDTLLDQYDAILPDNPTNEDIQYFNSTKQPLQYKIMTLIFQWITLIPQDFLKTTQLRTETDEFLASSFEGEKLNTIAMKIRKRLDHEYSTSILFDFKNKDISISNRKSMESVFEKVSIEDLGKQLAQHDSILFKSIHPIEFLTHIWGSKMRHEGCEEIRLRTPMLDQFIERFDSECYWVATELLRFLDLKRRSNALKKFINLAHECFEIKNFFSMFAIYYGLSLGSVTRLKKTWESLSDKTRKSFRFLEQITDPSKNHKTYRDYMSKCKPPVAPFLPIYLKDLTFMNDGNPSMMNGLLNMEKYRMMTNTVMQIASLGAVPFGIQEIPEIVNYLSCFKVEKDSAKLKILSLACEPVEK